MMRDPIKLLLTMFSSFKPGGVDISCVVKADTALLLVLMKRRSLSQYQYRLWEENYPFFPKSMGIEGSEGCSIKANFMENGFIASYTQRGRTT